MGAVTEIADVIDLRVFRAAGVPVADENPVHGTGIIMTEGAGAVVDDICMAEMEVSNQEDIARIGRIGIRELEAGAYPVSFKCLLPAGAVVPVVTRDPALFQKIIFRKDPLSVHDRDPEAGLIEEHGLMGGPEPSMDVIFQQRLDPEEPTALPVVRRSCGL